MIFKGLVATTVALGLAVSPAIAASNSAAALSLAPANEVVDGAELGGGTSVIVVLLAVVAAGLGIWAIVDDGGDEPVSA